MKRSSIKNKTNYFLGICALTGTLLFSSCGDSERRNTEDSEGAQYGMGADPESPNTATTGGGDMERTSNAYASQRNYDVNSMGTAAKNRKQMEATGQNINDQEYQQLRQQYDQASKQLRETSRQNPELSMRYTDDYQTADYSYAYYGLYLDNANDTKVRDQVSEIEKRRSDLRNQMRGKMDPKSKVYIAAEMDAVPKEGYDNLYSRMQTNTSSDMHKQDANVSGTVFVEFVVDKNGNVTNPKVIEAIPGQAPAASYENAGLGDNTGNGNAGMGGDQTTTGTGTSGEGTTDDGTNTGMTPNSTGTVGSGNASGSTGTTTGTTGNSTARTTPTSTEQADRNAVSSSGNTFKENSNNQQDTKQLEQRALKAVKATSGMWEPAQMNGKPVASLVQIPVPINMTAMSSGTNTGGNSGQMNNTNGNGNADTNSNGGTTNDGGYNNNNNNTNTDGGK